MECAWIFLRVHRMDRGDALGYRVVYGIDPKGRMSAINRKRLRWLTVVSFGFFVLLVRQIWPEGRQILTSQLLPDPSGQAQAAFSELLGNLRQGSGMMESLTVFCREILYEIT